MSVFIIQGARAETPDTQLTAQLSMVIAFNWHSSCRTIVIMSYGCTPVGAGVFDMIFTLVCACLRACVRVRACVCVRACVVGCMSLCVSVCLFLCAHMLMFRSHK